MQLHCKCGNSIEERDFQVDPTGTWCKECWGISQDIINNWRESSDNVWKKKDKKS